MFSILSTHACGYAIFVENDMGNTTLRNFSLFVFFSYIYEIHLFLFQYKLSPAVPLTITWEIFTRTCASYVFNVLRILQLFHDKAFPLIMEWMNSILRYCLKSCWIMPACPILWVQWFLQQCDRMSFLSAILPLELHLNPHTDCMSSV